MKHIRDFLSENFHFSVVNFSVYLNKRVLRNDNAKCAYQNQPMYAQSIIRTFALHLYILQYIIILLADSEGPDHIARMRRLI